MVPGTGCVAGLAGSDQFPNRLGSISDQVVRSSLEVVDGGGFGIESEVVIESGEEFGELDRSSDRFTGVSIGGSDDLPLFK